jgi:hypothetical protein
MHKKIPPYQPPCMTTNHQLLFRELASFCFDTIEVIHFLVGFWSTMPVSYIHVLKIVAQFTASAAPAHQVKEDFNIPRHHICAY